MAEQLQSLADKAGHGHQLLGLPDQSASQQQPCLDLTDLAEDLPTLASADAYDLIDLDQALPSLVSSGAESDELIDLDEAFYIPITTAPRPLPPLPVASSESSRFYHIEDISDSVPESSTSHVPPRPLPPLPTEKPAKKPVKMVNPNIPKPGPAKLSPNSDLDEWLSEAKQCHFLPEQAMKQLCERVKECLMEGWFICSFWPRV